MAATIRVESLSKRYRLGIVNHGMLYKDLQSWAARRLGRQDPHAKLGSEPHVDGPEHFWALKDLSFDVEAGDRVGLIGRNGAGKSTLLKILSRITAPTEGVVKLRGRIGSLLEVGTGFHPELTGRENVYLNGAILGMKRREVARKFDEIVSFSEIGHFIDTPVKRYSSGMYVRLAFSVVAHLDAEILLADEVLAVGDAAFQRKCLGKMEDVSRNQGRTVVFVSHNMGSVSALCNKGLFLERGALAFNGDMRDVIAAYLAEARACEARFADGLIEWARVTHADGEIVVEARYRDSKLIDLPCLGVKLSDVMGGVVFSVNPRNYAMRKSSGRSGERAISMRISQPRLHDGTYTVSLYFGDSKRDYTAHESCMSVTVEGGVALRRPVVVGRDGSVFASCSYEYS